MKYIDSGRFTSLKMRARAIGLPTELLKRDQPEEERRVDPERPFKILGASEVLALHPHCQGRNFGTYLPEYEKMVHLASEVGHRLLFVEELLAKLVSEPHLFSSKRCRYAAAGSAWLENGLLQVPYLHAYPLKGGKRSEGFVPQAREWDIQLIPIRPSMRVKFITPLFVANDEVKTGRLVEATKNQVAAQ